MQSLHQALIKLYHCPVDYLHDERLDMKRQQYQNTVIYDRHLDCLSVYGWIVDFRYESDKKEVLEHVMELGGPPFSGQYVFQSEWPDKNPNLLDVVKEYQSTKYQIRTSCPDGKICWLLDDLDVLNVDEYTTIRLLGMGNKNVAVPFHPVTKLEIVFEMGNSTIKRTNADEQII